LSFLQPALLAALPLALLPVVIHLVNQRRYQTVRWGAMMFLLAASRMSRGYARLRQWLILAVRVLAVAGLIFAASRPLAGGWLGLTGGGRAGTTLVLLDRSPSMRQEGVGGAGSKLESGVRQIARALRTLGSDRYVLIGDSRTPPRELQGPDALPSAADASPDDAAADVPGMLQSARDYLKANNPGRVEVWVCSDLRGNDWDPDGGRWPALRDAFLEDRRGVRFHLLAYPQPAPANLSVRVTGVRRRRAGDGAEVLVSLRVSREGAGAGGPPDSGAGAGPRTSVPVQFEVEGARSEVSVELNGTRAELIDHRIPVDKARPRGWGRVTIPADANPADNEEFFAFEPPPARRSVVVAEDADASRVLELAASIAPDPATACAAESLTPGQVAAVDWSEVALLVWQAPLPEGETARAVRSFVARGGVALFLPPRNPNGAEFMGSRWGSWVDSPAPLAVEGWRGDDGLLANTRDGSALPVGQLQVKRHCTMTGEATPLATLRGGSPLLTRVATDRGGVYFCATTPAAADSSLASGGVVLYVMVQRASADGAQALGSTRRLDAGDPAGEDPARWRRLAGPAEALSTDSADFRGVYASGEDRLLAVNRPSAEDGAPVLAGDRVAGLFRGLDFTRVDGQAGSDDALVQEIWRSFLIAMLAALVIEASLSLPRVAAHRTATATAAAAGVAS